MKLPIPAALAIAVVLAAAAPAHALFEVKDPISKMYNTGSRAVLVGTISAFDADKNVLTVKPFSAYKGNAPQAEALLVQISSPESLRKQVKVGEPIVLFQGARTAAVHVADHWYSAQPLSKPHVFNINGQLGHAAHTSHDESFPGKTRALVKALDEIKAGKSTLLDVVPDKLIAPPAKATFALPPNATGFAAVQLPAQKTATFVVASPAGLQLFSASGAPSKDNFGLDDLKPKLVAAATLEGKPVLLLDADLYTLTDGVFKKSSTLTLPSEKILAIAIDPLGDDNQSAAAVLTTNSLLRVPLAALQKDAPPDVDDDARLVGNKITEYHREHEKGFTAATMTAADLNADHRPDLVIMTPEGSLTLVNRGFGGFLVHKTAADVLATPTKMPLLAATADTIFALHPDGTVYTSPVHHPK